MSRSLFGRTTSPRDESPLLPQHTPPISLGNLSPRGASSRASPSPPPSFYRDSNPHTFDHVFSDTSSRNFSPSPSRTKSPRKIHFAAPPPPITSSVFLPQPAAGSRSPSHSHRGARRGSATVDPLVGLERREKALQQELQLLLDAQSVGLIQGFGGGNAGDGASDAGSSTPTMRSGGSGGKKGSVVPVRQPKRRIITLKNARRGLGKDMEDLVGVKNEEVGILDEEIRKREEVLGRVKTWEDRMSTVRGQLSGFSGRGQQELGGGEEAMEIAELQTEEKAVENEIREVEERLLQMRARQKWLKERIKEGMNRQEARLSSYRGALKEVEREVGEFLRRPPLERSVVMGDEEGFMSLPVQRRTLGMAREWWDKEVESLNLRKAEVEKERTALQDGESMWGDVVDLVTGFEDELRKQMKVQATQDPEMLRRQVEKMQMVIERLSDHARVAEKNSWNLLICAVGAELAAFKEGEAILQDVLATVDEGRSNDGVGEEEGGREESFHSLEDERGLSLSLTGTETNLNLASGQQTQLRHERSKSESEEDSDGPNLAELMVDQDRSESGV